MVKIQKRFAYKYKDREHYKHLVIIPEDVISKLGWDKNVELEPVVEGKKLIFKKKRTK